MLSSSGWRSFALIASGDPGKSIPWNTLKSLKVSRSMITSSASTFDRGDRKATTLVLFLPLTFYTFHREHYPAGLQDQLQEALNFDWQENLFLEHERTLHFSGPAVPVNHNLSVPIFSLQREIFDKFHQVLGAANFQNFRIIPTALAYRAFLASRSRPTETPEIEILCAVDRFLTP